MPIKPIYRKNGPNGLNWQCSLAGSSKRVPKILIFSIAMGADYSFEKCPPNCPENFHLIVPEIVSESIPEIVPEIVPTSVPEIFPQNITLSVY